MNKSGLTFVLDRVTGEAVRAVFGQRGQNVDYAGYGGWQTDRSYQSGTVRSRQNRGHRSPRQTSAVGQPRSMHMYLLQENLRYDKMAEGLGAAGEYVRTRQEFHDWLRRAWKTASNDRLSTPINVQAIKELFTSATQYPPGTAPIPNPASAGWPTNPPLTKREEEESLR